MVETDINKLKGSDDGLLRGLAFVENAGISDASMRNLIDLECLMLCNIPLIYGPGYDNIDNIVIDSSMYDPIETQEKLDEILDRVVGEYKKKENPKGTDGDTQENWAEQQEAQENVFPDDIVKPDPGRIAIVEFGCDTNQYPYEPYTWECSPGDSVNEEKILAFCKQDYMMKPVVSIFKKGVVRKDPEDGDFGRLFKTICSRHIIIDGYELGDQNAQGNVDIQALLDDPHFLAKFDAQLNDAYESMQILTEYRPYLCYLDLIANKTKPYVNSPLYVRTEPEDVFSKFINEQVKPIQEAFKADILKLSSEEAIRGTSGNPTKQRDLGQQIISRRAKYFDDMMKVCDDFCQNAPSVDGQAGGTEARSISKMMDFKLTVVNMPDLSDSSISAEESQKLVSYEEIDPVSEGKMSFQDYLSNVKKTIPETSRTDGDGQTMFARLRNAIDKCIGMHDSAGEGASQSTLKEEIEVLSDLMKECVGSYKNHAIFDLNPENDAMLESLLSAFPDRAVWPNPVDIEFDHITYQRYTFPNIDARRDEARDKAVDHDNRNQDYDDRTYWSPDRNDIDYVPSDFNLDIGDIDRNPVVSDASASPPADAQEIFDEPYQPQSDYPMRESDPAKNLAEDKAVTPDDFDYWTRYLSIATMVNLPFLATGLVISGVPVLLPCVYIPLKVLNVKKVSLLIVIGLAIRGVSINALVIYVNMSQDFNSAMIAATMALASVKDLFTAKLQPMNMVAPNLASVLSMSLKSNNTALMKENKKIMAEIDALRALQLPSKTEIIKQVKGALDIDPRNQVVRLADDASTLVKPIFNATYDLNINTVFDDYA